MMNSMTIHLSQKLKQIIDQALQSEVATHISLFVGFGSLSESISLARGRALDSTIYDLASLTKICGTTVAVAQAIIDGKMSLDERPFPAWPINIRSILSHTSGLMAHKRFYEAPLSVKNFEQNLLHIKKELFQIKPSAHFDRVYSDIGFIALGFLLEERYKKPLPQIFSENLAKLGIDFFSIPSKPPTFISELDVAPTGFCKARNNYVRGQVHDPNCFFMGGYGAHAGFFGDLKNVALMGQFFLSAVKNPNSPLKDLLAQFAKKGLGFDKRSGTGTQSPFSPETFGHFGYSGTSLWIDPRFGQKGLVVALLTNRVHKSVKPEGIYYLRLDINKAIKKFCS